MGRLPRRIWHGLNLIASGARDTGRFLKRIDREWQGQRWTTKAVLYPYKKLKSEAKVSLPQFGYQLIRDLKRQGFILKKEKGIFLTSKGRIRLEKIKIALKKILPIRNHVRQLSKELTIISFDIAERERSKRDWLRATLVAMGLKFYHQSLWMGYVALPEDFFHDLTSMNIDKYVAIFTVGKQGTLRKIF